MKPLAVLLLATAGFAAAADPAVGALETTAQARVGFDTNPLATSRQASAALTGADTFVVAASAGASYTAPIRSDGASLKLGYVAESFRYAEYSGEDHTTHRGSLSGQAGAAGWKLSGQGSVLLVDGDHDTLPSIAACNANGTALWRERRAQTQYRGALTALRDAGPARVRLTGTLLDYDYRTRPRAGYASFADRADLVGGADLGWKQSATSWWFAGARAGTQHQDTVPLPGGEFEYSNRYTRVIAGWEGRLGADTTLTFAAGPDFRHYSGAVDKRVFHDRDHTVGWFDTALTTKLSPDLTVTAKSTRWTWLSSTGKSAYTDFSGELVVGWTLTKTTTLKLSGKAHQLSYFPAVRNDWEYMEGLGLTYTVSRRWQFSADVLHHWGRNALTSVTDRDFARTVFWLGVAAKL